MSGSTDDTDFAASRQNNSPAFVSEGHPAEGSTAKEFIPSRHDADFFATGGAVPLRSPSYCTRSADEEIYAGLLRGEFCYILTTRQIGKTSLTARTAERLREEGIHVAFLDLTEVGADCTKEQWYYTLLSNVGEEHDLRQEVRALWTADAPLTPLQRWVDGLRMILRARPSNRLVIFIDEIDYVRALRFDTSEFFAAIRACYNRRTLDAEFERLTFCLLGVATPSDLIDDVRVTPFNIGRRIDLVDFSREEAGSLAYGFRCELFLGHALLERVLHWTGGHPYLTQRLCREIALRPETLTTAQVDRLCVEQFLSPAAQERDANLTFVRDRLLKSDVDIAALLCLYDQVYRGQRVSHNRADPLIDILLLSGLVRPEQDALVIRNRIYAHVFDRAWIRQHMPDAEQRRQRAAYRRGVLRAVAVSGAFLVVVSLALTAFYSLNAQQQLAVQSARYTYTADMNLVQQALSDGNVGHALDLLNAQRPNAGQEDLRGFEWRYLWRLCHGDLNTLHGHTGLVRAVAYSPDGTLLASAGDDKTIRIWKLATGKSVTLRGHQGWVFAVAFSPNGKILASGSADHTIKLWDVGTGRERNTLRGHHAPVNTLAFSPDGKLLASGDQEGKVNLWDRGGIRSVEPLSGHKGPVYSVVFSPDGKLLACGNGDHFLELCNTVTGLRIATFDATDPVFSVAFSHHGRLLASGQYNGAIVLRDLGTGHCWTLPQTHRSIVSSLAFSPDDTMLASASWDGTVKLWNVAQRAELVTLKGHAEPVNAVAFAPDGSTLASGSNDATVKLWDVTAGHLNTYREMLSPAGHHQPLYSLAFSADGRTLGSGSGDSSIILWDAITLRPKRMLPTNNAVGWFAFSPNGRLVALAQGDHAIRLWDVEKGRWVGTVTGNRDDIHSVAFSPDGKLLASGSDDRAVRLWECDSLRPVRTSWGHTAIVTAVAFSPDGTLLASGSDDKTVRLWDTASGRSVGILTGHTNTVKSLAFSPDGKMLASSSWDRSVILWDVARRERIATLKGHTNEIDCIALSPDGKTLASGSDDDTLKLWNVVTHQEMATFRFPSPVTAVTFARDDNTLGVGLKNGTLSLLRAATTAQVRDYEARRD